MKLPNNESAYVQQPKIVSYLLSEAHPVGKSKAKFFRSLGFDESNTELLIHGLLNIARFHDLTKILETIHGTKYVIVGDLHTPRNRVVTILTVWIVDAGTAAPRFITARPFKSNSEVHRD